MAAFLLLAVLLGAWSNHFENGFHLDDEHTIVSNPAVRDIGNIPRFFTNPVLFSAHPENADYRPVLSSLFTLDRQLAEGPSAFLFQAESFAWLLLEVLCVYILFRSIPGVSHFVAMAGAAVCALHPVLADVVNYPLQRGAMIGGAGVCAGLVLWNVWPRMLPAKLPLTFYQFPKVGREAILRWAHPHLSRAWDTMLRWPLPFYFVPVVFAMLAEPSVAAFPLLVVVWIVLFEGGKNLRRAVPSAVICGGFWIFRTIWILKLTPGERLPALSYWYTQPWVAVRLVLRFLMPANLSASIHLHPFASPFAPLALFGYAGLAGIVALAVFAARHRQWRLVAFGLWWFLVTFAPQALIPESAVGADERAVLPLIGLAFSICCAGLILIEKASRAGYRGLAEAAGWAATCAAIGVLGFQTFERNRAWLNDDTLWQDVALKNPGSGNALLNFGQLLIQRGDSQRGMAMVRNGAARLPDDANAEMVLAQSWSKLDRDAEAEKHFRRALELDPARPRNFSVYAHWLSDRQRQDEALAMARKALALNSADLVSRHIVIDDFSRHFKWQELIDYARETLRIAPQDDTAQNMISVAQITLDKIRDAEARVAAEQSVDNYLSLSVLYFQDHRYSDAASSARNAVQLNPGLPHGYANMAAAYYAMGRLDDSIDALRNVIRINPNMPGVKGLLTLELSEKSSVH